MVTILITILFNKCNFWVETAKSYISRKRYFNKKILILIKLTNGHSKRDGVNFTTTMLPATRYIFPFPNRIFIIYLIMDGNEEYFVLFKRAARNISSIIVCHKHHRSKTHKRVFCLYFYDLRFPSIQFIATNCLIERQLMSDDNVSSQEIDYKN